MRDEPYVWQDGGFNKANYQKTRGIDVERQTRLGGAEECSKVGWVSSQEESGWLPENGGKREGEGDQAIWTWV